MKVEYSRQAMRALLSLEPATRRRAIELVRQISSGDAPAEAEPEEQTDEDRPAPAAAKPKLIALVHGSEFQLAPYCATGDMVLARKDGRITVIALTDVLGGLKEASEQ
jgi:hypothetical protein